MLDAGALSCSLTLAGTSFFLLVQPADRRPDFRVSFDPENVFENVVHEAAAVGALGLPGLFKLLGNIHAEADGACDCQWFLLAIVDSS